MPISSSKHLAHPLPEPPEGQIPHFALYGEMPEDSDSLFVHIEDIHARSHLYDWRIRPHRHSGIFQLVFLAKGAATVWMDDELHNITGPCAITVPGGVVHGFQFEEGAIGHVVTLAEVLLLTPGSGTERQLLEPLIRHPRVIPIKGSDDHVELIRFILEQAKLEHTWPQLGQEAMMEWLLRILLLVCRRQLASRDHLSRAKGYRRDKFAKFRLLVEEHYRDHWQIADYADHMGLTQARLNRLCRSFANKTAQELVHDRLILEARRRLMYTSTNAAMVAHDLGFEDPGYFSRFFKRHTGLPPGVFQKQSTIREQGRVDDGFRFGNLV